MTKWIFAEDDKDPRFVRSKGDLTNLLRIQYSTKRVFEALKNEEWFNIPAVRQMNLLIVDAQPGMVGIRVECEFGICTH